MKARELSRAKGHTALVLAQQAGFRKKRIKRAEPDGLAKQIRRGASSGRTKGGVEDTIIPGASTRVGRALQEHRQLEKLQSAKGLLYKYGKASSPRLTGQDFNKGVSVTIATKHPVSGLAAVRSVKLVGKATAWSNPAEKRTR